MVDQPGGAAGSIYDLGYRRYDGVRLGRSHAIWVLFIYSLRGIFGIGRSTMAKVFPIGLAIIAFIPSLAQIAIAAISPAEFEVIEPVDYFGFVAIVVALFCAVVAPEIIGRDQRHQTLPLYFSRTLLRTDYVSAKIASLLVALLLIFAVPQLLLILGSAVASDDLLDTFKDEADQLLPIIASSMVVAGFFSAMSVTIASQSPRRAIATGAVLAYFIIFTTLGAILVDTTTGDVRKFSVLIGPGDFLEGAVRWIFDAPPEPDTAVYKANLAGGYYLLASVAYIAGSLAILYRRYIRLSV
jgi:ABC-2 type transport system permease protein